jgi:hypothetical protein
VITAGFVLVFAAAAFVADIVLENDRRASLDVLGWTITTRAWIVLVLGVVAMAVLILGVQLVTRGVPRQRRRRRELREIASRSRALAGPALLPGDVPPTREFPGAMPAPGGEPAFATTGTAGAAVAAPARSDVRSSDPAAAATTPAGSRPGGGAVSGGVVSGGAATPTSRATAGTGTAAGTDGASRAGSAGTGPAVRTTPDAPADKATARLKRVRPSGYRRVPPRGDPGGDGVPVPGRRSDRPAPAADLATSPARPWWRVGETAEASASDPAEAGGPVGAPRREGREGREGTAADGSAASDAGTSPPPLDGDR